MIVNSRLARTLCALAMGAGTALLVAGSLPATAADLYTPDDSYRSGAGTPYDDPRYADMYRYPPPPPRYAERQDVPPPPYPPRDQHGYLRPMPPPPVARAYGDDDCLSRHEMADRLAHAGWTDIERVQKDGPVARVRANGRDGRYDLTLDRCSGRILEANLLAPPAYAYAPPPPPRVYRGY